MWKFFLFIFVCLPSEYCTKKDTNLNDTLILTHIIYRHGDRTPEYSNLVLSHIPHTNKSFYPYGKGQLTLTGKKRTYNLGVKLRKRYSKFLGSLYYADLIEAISSSTPRSVISMQSVLAGLFPPSHEWQLKSGLEWQPVYFIAPSINEDKLIYPSCKKLYIQGVRDEETATFYNYISQNTGINITSSLEMLTIQNTYYDLSQQGYELPDWLLPIWPQPFAKYAVQFWKDVANQTPLYVIGQLLRKMNVDTMNKINNTFIPRDRKMFMYSAHDINIVAYLGVVGVYEDILYINYSTTILIEIHKINNNYFVKVLFNNCNDKDLQIIKIPACGGMELCSLSSYISITEAKYGPED